MAEAGGEDEEYYDNSYGSTGGGQKGNILPVWGNQASMNLNPLILTNITQSPYFKVNLTEKKVLNVAIFWNPSLYSIIFRSFCRCFSFKYYYIMRLNVWYLS